MRRRFAFQFFFFCKTLEREGEKESGRGSERVSKAIPIYQPKNIRKWRENKRHFPIVSGLLGCTKVAYYGKLVYCPSVEKQLFDGKQFYS